MSQQLNNNEKEEPSAPKQVNSNQEPEKQQNKADEYLKAPINKPNELKNFDAITHFKENITRFDKNCSEPVKDTSYYCFTCKHSVCNECGVYDHKEHLLIQRDNCLNYDKSFFNEIANVIEDGINNDTLKDKIKQSIVESVNTLKLKLDNLQKLKINEVDEIFQKIKENFSKLKENYIKAKENIENYYKTNEKFFNVHIYRSGEKTPVEKKVEKEGNTKKTGTRGNNDNYLLGSTEKTTNKDLENTVFLMNFELMNLCDNKNLQILGVANNIKDKINNIINIIETKTKETSDILDKYMNFNITINKFDDFYWDIKLRTRKYNEQIAKFKDTIFNIYKKNGSLDKLRDLLGLFDSKNKKGKDVLFNQEYFVKSTDIASLRPVFDNVTERENNIKRVNSGLRRTRTNSKNKSLSKKKLTHKPNEGSKVNEKLNEKFNKSNSKTKTTNLNTINPDAGVIPNNKEEIILNQRLLQRFFAYSIYEFYSKHFKPGQEEADFNESFIGFNDLSANNSNKNSSRNNSLNTRKKTSKGKYDNKRNYMDMNNPKSKKLNTVDGLNISNLNGTNLQVIQEQNVPYSYKSVSLLSNYTERYTNLKEKAKPIIGTNYIQLFEPLTNKISKVKVPLIKEDHGYSVFPEGCRHVLIDGILYITGGSDKCGYPINVVLSFDMTNGSLVKLPNLFDNHSYHSIEYLDNFDSIIIIGGENSNACEIMDLDSKTWTKLPPLHFPRANSNIYFNNITSDLFVLFGMEGEMSEKNRNTDVIEVLELNDIISGWIRVDYYKSVGLDLKNNYCVTFPFTRDKLLIYGGSSMRSNDKKIFALFDMIKNECIRLDTRTIDMLKLEELKIRAFDDVLNKNNEK